MAAVKALQQWCRIQCEGYRDVAVTNMTTSFRDGLAFCALIHKHRPDLINFDSLRKEDVYENNKLAFKVAEQELGIPALLDAEDMVALKVPDRLSILTYVSQYYNYFHGRSPIGGLGGIKRPAEGPTDEPSGKKNQPVVAKVFPSSKPARENSPPPIANFARPSPSPRQTKKATQETVIEKPHQTGTLSNKCVSCNKHVHLVQRHLVDGKLYHRSCAKLQSATNTPAPLRPLPTNTPVAKFTPTPDPVKTNPTAPTQTPPRLAPTSPMEKTSTASSFSSTFSTSSPSRPATGLSSTAKESPAAPVVKPTASLATGATTFTTTTSVTPTAAPRKSTTAEKTLQAKRNFFQSDNTTNNEEKKTAVINVDVNKGPKGIGKVQEATAGQAVTVVVNVGGADKKEANMNKFGEKVKSAGVGGKVSSKQEVNDTSGTNVAPKKTDKPQSPVETPKRETGAVKGRVRLKADPSILADLQSPETPSPAPSPASRIGIGAKSPDRGGVKPVSPPANASGSENGSPADWRSKLKPVTKETKPVGPSQSTKPLANGAGKSQASEISVGPVSSSSAASSPIISVTPSASEGFQKKDIRANGTKSKISKTRPDYIPTEDIVRELQDIEDNLNEWEKRGVELEVKLRSSEEEGEDESVMDELMVEWFNLIRNKQVAVRRESELVYIQQAQELEEEQPNIERELRRLMEKEDHLKTARDRKKEEELMAKLVEIVNDRNAIVEGLDEDRLREEEEDQELNKMMMNLNTKKDKAKKKSPMAKLFGWGNKKEG
ncbi:hypothetical protein Q5P01_025541 [Channa striata]|uniref:MICAL-like protein 2 n=1 Tax=Channa striata TaxID=64152 RepID=A0AA88LHF5_CHASR|nr:hypothetical protein Q5P01_025541 [Channa striata]